MESKTPDSRYNVGDDAYFSHSSAKSSKATADSQSKSIGTSQVHHHPHHAAESKSIDSPFPGSKASSGAKRTSIDSTFKEEKDLLDEIQQDIEADEEFERLKNKPSVPVPEVGRTSLARSFVRGFRILSMNMRDATTGRLMWRSADWDVGEMFTNEITEQIPKDILQCRVVSREIIFSSAVEMKNFRLEQRVYFQGVCIEEWRFVFGYVMAGSRNSWQQTIDAAPPSEMLPAEILSKNIVFETAFFDDKEFLCKNSIRIEYV